jgi:glycerophosphoryl diester phosphodiesterase
MPKRLTYETVALAIALGVISMSARGQMIVAHRGASHDAPENTLAAFQLAWEEGADGAEGDFHLSSDGHIVCIHDHDTKRTAGEKLVVAETTLAELQKLDVGSWKNPKYAGERIATLDEVLGTVPDGKRFFIELKTGPEIVAPLKKALADSPVPLDHLVVIAFDDETVAECKREIPDLKVHWLTGYKESKVKMPRWSPVPAKIASTLKATSADGLGSQANRRAFDAVAIEKLREAGLKEFHVWTVDDPVLAKFYIEQGVWSITTNRPAWLREQLAGTLGDASQPSAGTDSAGGS